MSIEPEEEGSEIPDPNAPSEGPTSEPSEEVASEAIDAPVESGPLSADDEAIADGAEVEELVEGDVEEDVESEDQPLAISRSRLKGLLEALIFVADKPIPLNDLVKTTGADRRLVRTLLDELSREYEGRGIRLQEVANGFLFRTSAEYAPFLRDKAAKKPVRMTRAQLETLAIIAYRQPLTRPEIDEIRGVDSGAVLKMLLERELVRILGKRDEPGRPLLYGTTSFFLEFFGLKSLKDLPTLRELTELTEESRRILEQKLGDEALADPEPTNEGSPAEGATSATEPNESASSEASEGATDEST